MTLGPNDQLQHPLRRPRDHGALPRDDDRPLHQLGMREEERDHLLARDVVARVEAELPEALVLPHEIGGRAGEEVEDARQGGPVGRGPEVLDDVARDAALAQDVQRAARLPSAGVVVDGHTRHGVPRPYPTAHEPGPRGSPHVPHGAGAAAAGRALSLRPTATTDITRSTSPAWQRGQRGASSPPKTSSSNSCAQRRQTYS
jgi:hypothetical protein